MMPTIANNALKLTVQDYMDALAKLPPEWLAVDYQNFVQAFLGNILVVANGCEITAYDKLDRVWKDPSRMGMP